MLVIRRCEDGQYVTPSGQAHSYTKDIRKARTFQTVAEAVREMCVGNETVVTVESQLGWCVAAQS